MSSFIFKLREIVNATDPSLSWGATGDSFKVADSATFSTSALSGYFDCSSFSAFLRQLHLHGFRRKVDDGNAWEFTHASFVKGKPALMSKIKCRLASSHTAPHKSAAATMRRVREVEEMLDSITAQMERRRIGGKSPLGKRKTPGTF